MMTMTASKEHPGHGCWHSSTKRKQMELSATTRRPCANLCTLLELPLLVVLLLLHHNVVTASASNPPSPSPTVVVKNNNNNIVNQLVSFKCGNNVNDEDYITTNGDTPTALWSYEGALLDPLTGNKICSVEGLELVKPLGSSFTNGYQEACRDLQVGKLLFSKNEKEDSSRNWNHASTVLSRRLFLYKTEESHNNNNDNSEENTPHLLQYFRARPNSPKRRIPTHQAMAMYDTATTYISSSKNKNVLVHSELLNHDTKKPTTVWGLASVDINDNNNNRQLHLTVHAKRQSNKNNKNKNDALGESMLPLPSTSSSTEDTLTTSPPRSRLIQFGSGNKQDKFLGARETYTYQQQSQESSSRVLLPSFVKKTWNKLPPSLRKFVPDNNKKQTTTTTTTVMYTRYGEGPPWYGPGRMCTLELRGKQISHLDQAPPLAVSLLQNNNSTASVAD